MRRITKLIAVGALGLALVTGTGSALAAPNDHALQNCIANIEKQGAKGLEAGGGPKSGSGVDNPAPTNCDHFWQFIGAIGNGQ